MNNEELSLNKKLWVDDYHGRLNLNMESIAGYGSSLYNTRIIIKKLPVIFKKYKITKMLDIPCADFYWMIKVDMDGVQYIGADFIDDLIHKNIQNHPEKDFRIINMMVDEIPQSDLIFCRDCIVHMSFSNIKKSILNFKKSNSKYLMVGTCPELTTNQELNGIIGWRPLNMEKEPFCFPKPLEFFSEETDKNPEKCMAMWSINDIKI